MSDDGGLDVDTDFYETMTSSAPPTAFVNTNNNETGGIPPSDSTIMSEVTNSQFPCSQPSISTATRSFEMPNLSRPAHKIGELDITKPRHQKLKDYINEMEGANPKYTVCVPTGVKAPVWHCFYKVILNSDRDKVFGCCNFCGALVQVKARSPTELRRHLQTKCTIADARQIYLKLVHKDAPTITKQPAIQGETIEIDDDSFAPPLKKKAKKTSAPTSRGGEDGLVQLVQTHLGFKVVARNKKEFDEMVADELDKAYMQYVAIMDRPVTDVESNVLRNLLRRACEANKAGLHYFRNCEQVKTKIGFEANDLREKLKNALKNVPCCATTDHWTSRAGQTYASFTVHWIGEDGVLHSVVLAVYLFKGSATGARIYDDFKKKMDEFDLDIRYVVTDTAANMNLFGQYLEQETNAQHLYCVDHLLHLVASIVFDAKVYGDFKDDGINYENDLYDEEQLLQGEGEGNVSTTDELVDRADAVVEVEVGDERTSVPPEPPAAGEEVQAPPPSQAKKKREPTLLELMRRIISYFNHSSQAKEILVEIQKKLHPDKRPVALAQDSKTRWWSTLFAIARFLELRPAINEYIDTVGFKKYAESDKRKMTPRPLSDNEWKTLEEIKAALQPLSHIQKFLEGEKYVTSSCIPMAISHIFDELKEMASKAERNQNRGLLKLAEDMMGKLVEQFGDFLQYNSTVIRGNRNRQVGLNKAIFFSHALDPRYKECSVLEEGGQDKEVFDDLVREMMKLRPVAATADDPIDLSADSQGDATPPPAMEVTSDKSFRSNFKKMYQKKKKSSSSESELAWRSVCQAEVTAYQTDPGLEDWDKNPLEWWKEKKKMYPNLWQLARLYLAIPATSAASERAFSSTSLIINPKRNRLDPKFVQDLQMLRDNWLKMYPYEVCVIKGYK